MFMSESSKKGNIMKPILYIVIPCYNEEEVIEETTKRISNKLDRMINDNSIAPESKILFVDDGSKDSTWNIIDKLYSENAYVSAIKLSRNKGHQNALMAGLMTAKECADCVVSMDADLQDDIEVLEQFVEEYVSGNEIVYGVRKSRKKDTAFKRNTAKFFYRMMRFLGVEIIDNHADYRLLGKKALEALSEFKEVNLFLRGIVPMIGFKTTVVEYERGERFAGKTHYPLKKMISFAIEGITSCSVKPIRVITTIGMIISLFSIFLLFYTVIGYYLGNTVIGWPTIMIAISFFGGFQIFAIGIVGEYIGKIYLEVKNRPRFFIEEKKMR